MNRRVFLQAILAAGAAPYVVTRAGVLMPVRKIALPDSFGHLAVGREVWQIRLADDGSRWIRRAGSDVWRPDPGISAAVMGEILKGLGLVVR